MDIILPSEEEDSELEWESVAIHEIESQATMENLVISLDRPSE
jgi:hypothetical protein